MSTKIYALIVAFGLFAAGTVGAAAYYPLETLGPSQAISAPAHAFHFNQSV